MNILYWKKQRPAPKDAPAHWHPFHSGYHCDGCNVDHATAWFLTFGTDYEQ
jgi:hypothetical protein